MNSSKGMVLIAGFFLLLCFPLTTKLLGLEYQTPLYNVSIASKPEFSLDDYWDGSYQKAYEKYEKTNFGNYPAIVKAYSQLRFNMFSALSGNYVVLENGALAEEHYIQNYLHTDISNLPDGSQMKEVHNKLARVKTLLEEQGKNLVLLINPSKVDIFSDEIPLRYRWRATYRARDVESLGDHLLMWAGENGIPCVDGRAIAAKVSEQGVPIFYNGGHHATKPTMFWITQGVCDAVQSLGYRLKQVQFDGYASSEKPHLFMDDGRVGCESASANSDWDFQRNSNLYYYPAQDRLYYYPKYSVIPDEDHDLPDIFLVGKSFNIDVQSYLAREGIGNRIYSCRYNQSYTDSNFNSVAWANRSIANMREDLAECDVVVLEYGEGSSPSISILASIDALLELLEEPLVQREGIPSFNSNYPSIKYANIVRGFYRVKEPATSTGFYWMTKSGVVNLSANGEFTPQSVVLDCSIPADAFQKYWKKEVSEYEYLVYINGRKTGAFPVGEERRETFCFDLSSVDAPDGNYCIEIIAPLYAQWKGVQAGATDDRELSLRVYSCSLSSHSVEELGREAS